MIVDRQLKKPEIKARILETLCYAAAFVDRIQPGALRYERLDELVNAYPLATLFHLVKQMITLDMLQEDLTKKLVVWRGEFCANHTRDEAVKDANILREIHSFISFASFVHLVHPGEILNRATVKQAIIKANRLHREEAQHAVGIILAAYTIGMEIWRRGSGLYIGESMLSDGFNFPPVIGHFLEKWYTSGTHSGGRVNHVYYIFEERKFDAWNRSGQVSNARYPSQKS